MIKLDDYRSCVFSVLKCGFGWGGCTSDGLTFQEVEAAFELQELTIRRGFDAGLVPLLVAFDLAAELHRISGDGAFLKRIDGKPNTYAVAAVQS